MIIICLWLALALSSFGILGFTYAIGRKSAKKEWNIGIDKRFTPTVSIIVPTYNEIEVIGYKLQNLLRLEYPKDLFQILFIDSGSSDSTIEQIECFIRQNSETNAQLIVENDRRGKSAALNTALQKCSGEMVVISDADCFWPGNILKESLPYLVDPRIGAISGPKILLNPEDSWVTKSEDRYLKSANLIKLGDSKKSATILFEGGFSAYKKESVSRFDPYETGSDDCGTVVNILEGNQRAIMVPEAAFFTAFPRDLKGKIVLKTRRATQLVSVLTKYVDLLVKGKIAVGRSVVFRSIFTFLIEPVLFFLLLLTTPFLVIQYPVSLCILLVFFIPKVGSYLFEVILNNLIMFLSIAFWLVGKNFQIWDKPNDRRLVKGGILAEKGLI